jgi:hypothetical protein
MRIAPVRIFSLEYRGRSAYDERISMNAPLDLLIGRPTVTLPDHRHLDCKT